MASLPLISVVDDDDAVRKSLHSLIRSLGFAVEVFASAEEFLQSDHVPTTRCLILDVRMHGMNGLELQRRLMNGDCGIPIIFITAHGDRASRSEALKYGAVDYLSKPFSDQALLNAIDAALSLELTVERVSVGLIQVSFRCVIKDFQEQYSRLLSSASQSLLRWSQLVDKIPRRLYQVRAVQYRWANLRSNQIRL